jgi:hypothetical protein
VDNQGPGIQAMSGITLVRQSGFENNLGTGAIVGGAASFADVTFSTWGVQTVGIGGYLTADQVSLLGVGSEYYGAGANPTVLANLQGTGVLAIAGTGNVVVGPGITLAGGTPYVAPPRRHDRARGLVDHRVGCRHPWRRRHPQRRRCGAAHRRAQRSGHRRRHAGAGH